MLYHFASDGSSEDFGMESESWVQMQQCHLEKKKKAVGWGGVATSKSIPVLHYVAQSSVPFHCQWIQIP